MRTLHLVAAALIAGCSPRSPLPAAAAERMAPPCMIVPADRESRHPGDGSGTVFSYDDRGRARFSYSDFAGSPAEPQTYHYSLDGREVWITRHGQDPEVTHDVRDSTGRLLRRERTRGGKTEVIPDEAVRGLSRVRLASSISARDALEGGRVITEHLKDGTRVVWEWNEEKRTAHRLHVRTDGTRESLDAVSIDDQLRIVRITAKADVTGRPTQWTDFVWDGRDHLVKETSGSRSDAGVEKTVSTAYFYDSFGTSITAAREGSHRVIPCTQGAQRVETQALTFLGEHRGAARAGTWTVMTAAGWKLRDITYMDGTPSRLVTFTPTGERYEEGALTNGMRDGTWTRYWENGNLRERGPYAEGRRHGAFEQFDEEGSSLGFIGFERGFPLCPRRVDHPGKVRQDGSDATCAWLSEDFLGSVVQVSDGRAHGRDLSFDWTETGRRAADVRGEVPWVSGLRHGRETTWDADGKQRSSARYWFGERHGAVLQWNAEGKPSTWIARAKEPRLGLLWTEDSRTQVQAVIRGSAAEKAGFLVGDIVIAVAGKKTTGPAMIAAALAPLEPVTFSVIRGTSELEISAAAQPPPPLDENGRWPD